MTGRLKDPRPTLERYDVSESGCWEWAGARLPSGYGRTGTHEYAHRHFYRKHIGPIPEGLVVDHLCMNPPCVNPAHLEPVTYQTNTVRAVAAGVGQVAKSFGKTACKNGHELTPDNQIQNRPTRCKTCMRDIARARAAEARAAVSA